MKTSIKIKQMKKKILLGSIASLFAIATVFNMGLLNFNKQSDATLEAITIMVKAQEEASWLTGFLHDTFGGKWSSREVDCEKTVSKNKINLDAKGFWSNGLWIDADLSYSNGNFKATYPITVCVSGRGNCWSSDEC